MSTVKMVKCNMKNKFLLWHGTLENFKYLMEKMSSDVKKKNEYENNWWLDLESFPNLHWHNSFWNQSWMVGPTTCKVDV